LIGLPFSVLIDESSASWIRVKNLTWSRCFDGSPNNFDGQGLPCLRVG